jgi:hypothetical protein
MSRKVTKSEKTEMGSETKAFIVEEQESEGERVEVVEAEREAVINLQRRARETKQPPRPFRRTNLPTLSAR